MATDIDPDEPLAPLDPADLVDLYTVAALIAAWRPDAWPRPLRPTETD